MKVKVIQPFRDKMTGKVYQKEDEIQISDERAVALVMRGIVAQVADEVQTMPSRKSKKQKDND